MNWQKYAAYGWLAAGVVVAIVVVQIGLVRTDTLGLSETVARALLVNWSVFEQIANPIVILGVPDFRALLFLPLGAYWPGSMVAVKVFTVLLMTGAAAGLFYWTRERFSAEVALLGTGLLVLSPLTWLEINSLGYGPFLLATAAAAVWVYRRYTQGTRQLAGWYFLQILLMAVAVSIHPAGLAYPAALVWHWLTAHDDKRQQKQFLLGAAIATICVLLLRWGWHSLEWFTNPLPVLSAALISTPPDAIFPPGQLPGALLLLILLGLAAINWKQVSADLWGKFLLLAAGLGLVAADTGWALLATTLCIYLAMWQLLQINNRFSSNSFFGQRGLVFVVVFALATLFMIGDKTQRQANARLAVSPQDRLLQVLGSELSDSTDPVKIGSQWPARTMLATRHPAFPLPPAERQDKLLTDLSSVGYLVFDPFSPENATITKTISDNTSAFETAMVEERGVVVKVRGAAPPIETATPTPNPSAGSESNSTLSAAPNG